MASVLISGILVHGPHMTDQHEPSSTQKQGQEQSRILKLESTLSPAWSLEKSI